MMTIRLMAIWFCISILSCSFLANAEEVIRLGNGEWPPYTSEKLEHYGPLSQIVSEAFSLMGITVEYEFYPWKRALHMTEEGKINGVIAIARYPEREKIFWFNDGPIIVVNRVFFHRKDFPFDWNDVGDLHNVRVGVSLGYIYGENFDNAVKTGAITVDQAPTDSINMRKLLASRIDIFPITREVGYYLLSAEFTPAEADALTYHPTPVSSTDVGMILSKKIPKNEELRHVFNTGFELLKKSGRYDMILDKFHKELNLDK